MTCHWGPERGGGIPARSRAAEVPIGSQKYQTRWEEEVFSTASSQDKTPTKFKSRVQEQ